MSEIDLILDITEDESNAFGAYKDKYASMKPPPRRPGASGLGWQFWVTVPCALSAIILAALRTANIFYKAALLSDLGDFFSLVEAFVAMLAIEGGLVAYAAIRSDRKAQDEDIRAIRQHDTRLFWAIILMVLVSVVAGLGQSATVVDNMGIAWANRIQYALFLVTGIGASLIAWIGGEVLGSQVALAGIENEKRMTDWREQMESYMTGLRSSWSRSQERKMVRGELAESSVSSFGRRTSRVLPNSQQVRDEIIAYIENVLNQEGRTPAQVEVVEATGRSKSYVNEVYREYFGEENV